MTDYLVAFLIVMAFILACLLVLGLIGWSARRQAKRKTPPRLRLPREPEIDLGAERWAYCSRRDAAAEARALRRVA